jgi:micrococcal nuclease
MYEYTASVTKVIDGDTVDFSVDLGLRVFTQARCRLYGLNAPEKNTAEGRRARDYLNELLPVGTVVTLRTHKDATEKYGRWLAEISVSGVDINHALLEAGLAKPWDGKGVRPV